MSVFYSPVQHRVRAAWRLLLQAALLLVPALFVSSVLPPFLANTWGRQTLDYLPVVKQGLLLAWSLFVCWLAARFLDRRPFRKFGFHFSPAWWRDLVFGLALGAVLMLAIFLVERAAGWITVRRVLAVAGNGISLPGTLIVGVIGYIFVGIYEELFFRGYQVRNLAEGLRWRFISPRAALVLAWVLSSVIFGLLHLGNANAGPFTTPVMALTGLVFGLCYILTGELALSIGLHITWNFFQGYVFGFHVSGAGHDAALIVIDHGGPVAWTGGAWGPEGGLVGLLALLAGALAIVAWARFTRGAVRLQDQLAIYQPSARASEDAAASRLPLALPRGS